MNTLESMVGWYVYKIVMIRVFFFSGGKCKDCMYSHQFPPPNFHDRFLHGQKCGNKQNLRPCRDQEREAPLMFSLMFSKASRAFSGAYATLPKTSAKLSAPNFLLSCKGPIFFRFQRTETSVCFTVQD